MQELSFVLAIVLFAVGAILALPQTSHPIGTFVTRLGFVFLTVALALPLWDSTP